MKHLPLLLLLILLLASCSGGGTQAPAVAIPLDVALTPALQPLADALRTCAAQQPAVVLVVHERSTAALFDSPADLYFILGEPDPLPEFSAQIAWEQVVLVAHPSADTASWALSLIRTMFTSIPSADSPLSANVWVPLDGDETMQAFQTAVLGSSRLSPEARLAPNPAAVLSAVSSDPAALGILPAAWLDASVQSIDLGIRLPVLLTALQTPSGPALELAACLQSAAGQTVLAERYQPWDAAPLETPAP